MNLSKFIFIIIFFIISTSFANDKEKILFEINNDNVEELAGKWEAEFGTFNEVFSTQIMQKGNLTDTQYYHELLVFTQHNDMREAYDSVAFLFADFSEIEEKDNGMFNGMMQSLFPSVYTFPFSIIMELFFFNLPTRIFGPHKSKRMAIEVSIFFASS